jgi:hypothetical protein
VQQSIDPTVGLRGVHFTDSATGTIVGTDGKILRTTTGGATWIGARPAPAEQISLARNYPNPVSMRSTIPFTLARAGQVSLKVYDVLGSEVAVLVDEELTAGTHTARFDAAALRPGTYICVLRSGAEVRTMRVAVVAP